MVKKALVVGCDYPGTVSELKGSVNDAYLVAELLTQRLGFPREQVCFLVDRDRGTGLAPKNAERRPCRQSMLRALDWLCESGPGDVLFFSFSGLGTQTVDADGADEDAMHEALCPSDFAHAERGQDSFPYRLVHDAEVQARLHRAHPMAHLLCLFDCNHAGTMVPVPHKLDGTTIRQVRVRPPRGFLARTRDERAWKSNETPSRPRFLPALSLAKRFPAEARGLGPWGKQGFAYCFTAARDDQTALEVLFGPARTEAHGLLTHTFCASLESLRYNCSYEQLFERMGEQLSRLRLDPGLAYSNQHVQFSFADGLTPADERRRETKQEEDPQVFGVPSAPAAQQAFLRTGGAPAVTKSALVNAHLQAYCDR